MRYYVSNSVFTEICPQITILLAHHCFFPLRPLNYSCFSQNRLKYTLYLRSICGKCPSFCLHENAISFLSCLRYSFVDSTLPCLWLSRSEFWSSNHCPLVSMEQSADHPTVSSWIVISQLSVVPCKIHVSAVICYLGALCWGAYNQEERRGQGALPWHQSHLRLDSSAWWEMSHIL